MAKMKTIAQYDECLSVIHETLAEMLPTFKKIDKNMRSSDIEENIYQMLWHLSYVLEQMLEEIAELERIADDLESKLEKQKTPRLTKWKQFLCK